MNDDETPIEPARLRRISTQITAWGGIAAFLAMRTGKGQGNRPVVSFGLDKNGDLCVILEGMLDETIKADEEPSVVAMRVIKRLVALGGE